MVMARWDPFSEMMSLRQAMDRLFEDAFVAPSSNDGGRGGGAAAPPLDLVEHDDALEVRASLPGVRPEDVRVGVEGNVLTIEGEIREEREQPKGGQQARAEGNGQQAQQAQQTQQSGSQRQGQPRFHFRERRYGRFFRQIALPAPVDADRAQANFENGVLTLRLPKAEEARRKQIRVTGGSQAQQLPASQSNASPATAQGQR